MMLWHERIVIGKTEVSMEHSTMWVRVQTGTEKISRLIRDLAQCTVRSEGTHTAEVNQTASVT